MSQARVLYHLQEIELSIIDRHKRIKEINVQLEDNEIIQQAQSEFDEAKAKLDEILKHVKNIELQIETVTNKQKATESRLYSGNVKNPKELQDMQNEIESLTRRRGKHDDELLEIMVKRDDAQAYFELTDEQLKEVTQTWEAEHIDLLEEKERLMAEAEKLMLDRKKQVQAIDSAMMQEYNSLRKSKSNRPIAVMEDKSCKVCGIEQNNTIVSAINQDGKLIKCQNCGRILVRM